MSRSTKVRADVHPYIGLLKDPAVCTLWAGQALSDAGSELYRLGAIWLAVGIAGADAAWLPIAQSAAMLAFAVGAGAVIDGLSARRVMIWADLARAFVSAAVVVAAFTVGLSLPLLIAAGVLLAGIQAVFDPALQAVVPRLMPDPHRFRALNGLFDVTGRLACLPPINDLNKRRLHAIFGHWLAKSLDSALSKSSLVSGRPDVSMQTDDRAPPDALARREPGEMKGRVRAFDWSATPLKAQHDWPEALSHTVRLVLASPAPMLIWWSPELIQIYNDAYARTMGADRHPAALGQPARACWSEIWDAVGRGAERVMAGGSVSGNGRLLPVTRDGMREDVWWDFSYSPIEDRGAVGGVLVICNDVTERVKAEEHQRLLAGEMHHRMKNGLAVIQSLVALTARSARTVEEYRDALAARIQALAATQDLFIQSEGEDVEVSDLLATELAPFLDSQHRAVVRCPPMTASSRSANGISLIVHELFTNAVKYGAFATPTGRVAVDCSASAGVATITWRESGCSGVKAIKRGFGTTLIERVATDLGGSAALNFHPTGLEAVITIELAQPTV